MAKQDDENDFFAIADVYGYCNELRQLACIYALELDDEEPIDDSFMDQYISIGQARKILEKYGVKDEQGHHVINMKMHERIYDEIEENVYGVSVAKLAAADQLDCWWDDKLNTMMFSLPEAIRKEIEEQIINKLDIGKQEEKPKAKKRVSKKKKRPENGNEEDKG